MIQVRLRLANGRTANVDLPGDVVGSVLKKYMSKSINLEKLKELVDEIAAKALKKDDESVSQEEREDFWNALVDNDVFNAMGINVPSTHIKYANEMKFDSEEKAFQYLADITGRTIKVAN